MVHKNTWTIYVKAQNEIHLVVLFWWREIRIWKKIFRQLHRSIICKFFILQERSE